MPNNENLENTSLQEGEKNTGEQQGNEPPVENEVGIYQLLNGMWNKIDDNVSAASQEAQAQYTTFKENNMDPVIEGWAIDHLQTSDLLKELTMMFSLVSIVSVLETFPSLSAHTNVIIYV